MRRTDDGGAVLILAIVLITVFAVLALAVLAFAGTSFRRTGVVRDRVEKTAAANAGIRYAIEQLGINSTTCALPGNQSPGGATVRLPGLVLDRDVDLTCTWASGLPQGVNGWALAITGENVGARTELLVTQGGSSQKPVIGPVYLPTEDPDVYSLSKELGITTGNLVVRHPRCDAGTTNPDPDKLVINSPVPPYGVDCTTLPWRDVVTLPTLPQSPPPVPADQDPAPGDQKEYYIDIPGCRVFFPGTYNGADSMPLGPQANYLASGVYYLNGFGEYEIATPFRGGQAGVDTALLNPGSCGISDASLPNLGQNGTGVTLILGGAGGDATRFKVDKGQFEIFRRTTTDPNDPLTNVSVVSVPPGTDGWTAHEPDEDAVIFETVPGAKTDSVVHGTWVTPTGGVEFGNITSPRGEGQFLGGVVASRAILQSSQSPPPGSFIIATDVGPFTRDLVLESRAFGKSSDMIATVVVSVSNESGRPVAIRSWRVNSG